MTEHLCVTCAQLRQGEPRIYDRKAVCEPCRSRLRTLIREIDEYYDGLPDQLARSGGVGQRVSGSREAPLPLRVDPLDLMLPARTAAVHEPPCTCTEFRRPECRRGHPHLDQTGQVSVATRLDAWVQDWRDVLGLNEGLPRPDVKHLTAWLLNRLEDACDGHPAIDDFAFEMRELASVLRRTVGASEVKPEHLDVPCRRCDLLDLHRLPGEDRIECGSCGCLMTETEFNTWTRLLAAHMKETVG